MNRGELCKTFRLVIPTQTFKGSPGRRSPEGFTRGNQGKELSRFFNGFPTGVFFEMTNYGFAKLL
jgi:hypothetical protein